MEAFIMNKEVKKILRSFGYLDIESVITDIDQYRINRKSHKMLTPEIFIERLKTETDYTTHNYEYRRAVIFYKLFAGGLLSYADPVMEVHTKRAIQSFPVVVDDSTVSEWYLMLTNSLKAVLSCTNTTTDTITANLV